MKGIWCLNPETLSPGPAEDHPRGDVSPQRRRFCGGGASPLEKNNGKRKIPAVGRARTAGFSCGQVLKACPTMKQRKVACAMERFLQEAQEMEQAHRPAQDHVRAEVADQLPPNGRLRNAAAAGAGL